MAGKTSKGARARPRRATTTKPKGKGQGGKLRKLAADLRAFATAFPGAHEDYPWGERVVKGANDKVFAFLGDPYMLEGHLCLTVKLPHSRRDVLKLPVAKPCGYGLGKHGWVTFRIKKDDVVPPLKLMHAWISESHEAVAGQRSNSSPRKVLPR